MDEHAFILDDHVSAADRSFTTQEVLNIIREFCVRGLLADVSTLIGAGCAAYRVPNSAQLFC